jgi:hypothetical protein
MQVLLCIYYPHLRSSSSLKHSGVKVLAQTSKVAALQTWLALIWLTFTENAIMNTLSDFWFWMAFQEPVTEIHSWDQNKAGRRAAEPATLGKRNAGF